MPCVGEVASQPVADRDPVRRPPPTFTPPTEREWYTRGLATHAGATTNPDEMPGAGARRPHRASRRELTDSPLQRGDRVCVKLAGDGWGQSPRQAGERVDDRTVDSSSCKMNM